MNKTFKNVFAKAKLENRSCFVGFVTGMDPDFNSSKKILIELSKYCDVIEVGIPFNTSTSDSSIIMSANDRAIKSGVKTSKIFKLIKEVKNEIINETAFVTMGYLNQIHVYGIDKFIKDCKKNLVSGLIIVDLPWPLNKKFSEKCEKNSICFIQLVSPTTKKDRLKEIVKHSHELVYIISMLSTTGGRLKVSSKDILKRYNYVKSIDKSKYYIIGFGITENNISSLKSAQGLVCGSNLCRNITDSIKKNLNPAKNLYKLTLKLKNKIK